MGDRRMDIVGRSAPTDSIGLIRSASRRYCGLQDFQIQIAAAATR